MVNKRGLNSIDLCVVALLISITLLVTTVSAASITVTTPNGGETWHQGTLQMIQWIYTGDEGSTVKIELLKAGVLDQEIVPGWSGLSGAGSYIWPIPDTQTMGNDYTIRINSTTNSMYGDTSDAPFTITSKGPNTTTNSGIYRNSAFYLRNSNTAGNADLVFGYGIPGDTPLVGDWNGDGVDNVGIYRNGAFYLRNSNTAGNAEDFSCTYGIPGDTPLVGDWNGDGIDTISIYRNGAFYLKNSNTDGNADLVFSYGILGDIPVVGDWNGDGVDTVGIYRNGAFYLRNSNTAGNADLVFGYGIPGDTPLAGAWNGW